jgi:hypothetical protein
MDKKHKSDKGPIHMICKECGSDNVVRDAWASWDLSSQQWVLEDLFDYGYCNFCEGESRIQEITLSEED